MSSSLTRTATIVLAKRDTKKFEEALGSIPALENLQILSEGKAFEGNVTSTLTQSDICLLYTSPSPRDQRGSRMPSSA